MTANRVECTTDLQQHHVSTLGIFSGTCEDSTCGSSSPGEDTEFTSPGGLEELAGDSIENSKREARQVLTVQGTVISQPASFFEEGGVITCDMNAPEPVLSLRMLMNSKDVGSIIGKDLQTFEEDERILEDENGPLQVTFRLVIQTSQCGSLIGKGGTRIKEIREVAGETLPNSTERAVTISGSPESLTLCISQICNIILENPPRGPNIPYKPHTLPNQAYQPRSNLPYHTPYTATFHTAAGPTTTSQQMRIPNDLIGCVIGRKGSKIHEIRVSSGAQIKIAGNEGDSQDRLVTITGTPEAVGVAQYLINSRIHSEVNSFISVGMTL